jgi:hypothetical protein
MNCDASSRDVSSSFFLPLGRCLATDDASLNEDLFNTGASPSLSSLTAELHCYPANQIPLPIIDDVDEDSWTTR